MRPCYDVSLPVSRRRPAKPRRLRRLVLVLSLLLAFGFPSPTLATSPGPHGLLTSPPAVNKIDPELQRQMARNPMQPRPVIVEMAPLNAPFPARADEVLAQRAVGLLSQYGKAIGGIALIDSAAGWANASGITAIGADPRVAFIHADSIVQPAATTTATALATAYPRAVGADKAW